MIRRPPRSTRTDTLFPYTTRFRSMLKRRPSLDIAIVEPSEDHYYQPGWTMVGGGIFEAPATHRTMASVMPEHATWLRQAAASFQPESNQITLADGSTIDRKSVV